MAEQLELLFEVAPAAPERPDADPAPSPKTGDSGRFRQRAPKNIVHNGPQTAPRQPSGTGIPPESTGHAGPALGAEPAAIPARCPVVVRAVCYYADCRHYQRGGCVHPEAVRPRRRRR